MQLQQVISGGLEGDESRSVKVFSATSTQTSEKLVDTLTTVTSKIDSLKIFVRIIESGSRDAPASNGIFFKMLQDLAPLFEELVLMMIPVRDNEVEPSTLNINQYIIDAVLDWTRKTTDMDK